MRFDLDRLLFQILCLYAFVVPFELVLEIFFGIDTIFKPYRVVCLVLIGLYGIRVIRDGGLKLSRDFKEDSYLYLVFVYGILISFYNMIVAEFSLGKFYNEVFQTGLYFSVFVIVKSLPMTREELQKLQQFLFLGLVVNGLYVFLSRYVFLTLGRQSGFFDNPNYLSLGMIYALGYIAVNLERGKYYEKLLHLFLIVVCGMTFLIAGSRTGAIVMAAVVLLILSFQSLRSILIGVAMLAVLSPFFFLGSDSSGSRTNTILEERLQDRDITDDPRFPIWEGVIRASQQTYFIGLGLGQFEARFPEFYREENNLLIYEILSFGYHLSPHSDYMAVLITYGIIGLVFFLMFLFYSVRKILRQLWTNTDRYIYRLQLLGIVTIIIFGVAAENFVSGLYWMILTLSTKSIYEATDSKSTSESKLQSKYEQTISDGFVGPDRLGGRPLL
ncbi:MAG: O-antigen ligase family protein [Bacteroidota bacterium]